MPGSVAVSTGRARAVPSTRPKVAPWRERRRGVAPVVPKHVSHCSRNGSRSWWVYTWRKSEPGKVQRAPYCCNSWRHAGDCARHEAAVTFARIRDACAPLDADGFVFLVLTLDRDGRASGKPWTDAREAYRELSSMSRKLLKRVNRMCEANGWERPASRWVAVVEAHRSGMPHVNFMVYAPELARALANARARKLANGATEREAVLLDGELLEHATGTGWGHQSTAEQCRDRGALAGYITKLTTSEHVHATAGELAKLTQAPLNAPSRFRRLRAGKGFLAPRNKNADVTGTLVRRRREPDGTVTVLPLHNVKCERARSLVVTCCYHEEELAHAELQGRVVHGTGAGDAQLFALNPALLPGFVLLPLVSSFAAPQRADKGALEGRRSIGEAASSVPHDAARSLATPNGQREGLSGSEVETVQARERPDPKHFGAQLGFDDLAEKLCHREVVRADGRHEQTQAHPVTLRRDD